MMILIHCTLKLDADTARIRYFINDPSLNNLVFRFKSRIMQKKYQKALKESSKRNFDKFSVFYVRIPSFESYKVHCVSRDTIIKFNPAGHNRIGKLSAQTQLTDGTAAVLGLCKQLSTQLFTAQISNIFSELGEIRWVCGDQWERELVSQCHSSQSELVTSVTAVSPPMRSVTVSPVPRPWTNERRALSGDAVTSGRRRESVVTTGSRLETATHSSTAPASWPLTLKCRKYFSSNTPLTPTSQAR